jgi:hypothetical protein
LLQPANATIRASSINQEVKEILRAACDILILQIFELSDTSTPSPIQAVVSSTAAIGFICANHHHRRRLLSREHWKPWTASLPRRY